MRKKGIRDCYDTTTSMYYQVGHMYEFEEGDMIAETKHFIGRNEKEAVPEEKAELDPKLKKKTLKYLAKKYPDAAKNVDLRTKGAHRSMVYEIMKQQGTIESIEEEGKTQGEYLIEEKATKLAASRKR